MKPSAPGTYSAEDANRRKAGGVPDMLTPADASLVEQISELTRAPEMTPARRVAFHRALDEKLAERSTRFAWPAVGALVAASAAVLLWIRLEPGPMLQEAAPSRSEPAVAAIEKPSEPAADAVEALLYLTSDDAAEQREDGSLPEDYAAIESIFLGG